MDYSVALHVGMCASGIVAYILLSALIGNTEERLHMFLVVWVIICAVFLIGFVAFGVSVSFISFCIIFGVAICAICCDVVFF